MPVEFRWNLTREMALQEQSRLFLFGDNFRRKGRGGLAFELRGLPNAHGIRTKWEPTMNPQAFWTDDEYDQCVALIEEDLVKPRKWLDLGRVVVVPRNGIGTGTSLLDVKAPRVFEYLWDSLNSLDTQ